MALVGASPWIRWLPARAPSPPPRLTSLLTPTPVFEVRDEALVENVGGGLPRAIIHAETHPLHQVLVTSFAFALALGRLAFFEDLLGLELDLREQAGGRWEGCWERTGSDGSGWRWCAVGKLGPRVGYIQRHTKLHNFLKYI